jgi:hypothetical protein
MNRSRSGKAVALYAAVVSFLTYATVYGFRKGFTVCSFEGMQYAGISYKVWLVISQVFGYACSKFYGIRFISELKRIGRGRLILLLTGISWLALLLLALVPAPWNIPFMLMNGFPLGIIWGIVFSYVEGRQATDFIGAALSVSFIFSSGFVKSVAEFIRLRFAITEYWIPFFTGLVFAVPLVLFVFLLERTPPPAEEDRLLRTARQPMPAASRKAFIRTFLPGLAAALAIYVFATLFRDIRDNFIAEMWNENGYGNQPAVFTRTETPITLILLILTGSMILVRDNMRALLCSHYIIAAGFLLTGGSSLLFLYGKISAFWWLTSTGLGLYAAYIPFNCVFFERLIASFRIAGNVGFLIYVADSFGYLGSVIVLVSKEVLRVKLQWTAFYAHAVAGLSVLGIAGTVYSLFYFTSKYKKEMLHV